MPKPNDLVWQYKVVYEEITKSEYTIESRDFKAAKEFLALNDWNMEKIEVQVRSCLPSYLKDKWWADQNFPCYGFLSQFNKWKPTVKEARKEFKPVMYECSYCGMGHAVGQDCPKEKKDLQSIDFDKKSVLIAIEGLANKMRT